MSRMMTLLAVTVAFVGSGFAIGPKSAEAQLVTSYYPVQPAVSYVPTRAGLFGRQVVYRPVVAYSAPVTVTTVAPAVSYYAPTTTYYAPTTTYYAPSQVTTTRVVVPAPVPVRTYYYAPRRVYRRPVVVVPY